MVLIVSHNAEIERSLQKNVALSTQAGAAFSEDLVIRCIDGNLSGEAPPDAAGELLMRLPWDCLVPVELFRLCVADDDIVVLSHEPTLTGECVSRMEALVELYNLTAKLARHRRTSPWALIASHPEIFRYVARRLPGDLSALFEKFVASGDVNKFMLDTFLHTRAFDYRDTEQAPSFPVLMPVIEFLNHHLLGAPVQLEDQPDDDRSLTIKRSVPVPGAGNECFAFYGVYDRFDTWVSYGFVDEVSPFIRSVPMKIVLPRLGTIQLANFTQIRDREDLPPSMADLHLFVPKLLFRRESQIEVAALLLAGPRAPDALRRTLVFLINEMSPGHPGQRDLMLHAEEQIVAANRTYYAELLGFLRSLTLKDPGQRPILDNFVRMCGLQLASIQSYPDYGRG